jgi:lipoprotein-releasing system permease protein
MREPSGTHPFAPFEWLLSLRYLRARRQEGFISVNAAFSFLGIMLGVATLIIVMAVMNGFRKELLDKILGLNGHLLIQPLESPLTDWQDVAERVGMVDGIKLAAPIVEGQALASSPFSAAGVLARGVRSADLLKLPSVANNIRQGTLEGFDEGQGVAIGRRLADQLSLRAGDSVTLVAPRGAVTPMGTTPRIKTYKIAAVFEIGMSEYDAAFVFMPLAEAQAYFNRAGDVTAIEVYTDNPDRIDRSRKLVAEAANRPIYMVDWRQRNATFFNALQVERNVMFLILTIIVIVAAFNITSGLIMLVKDKGRDIGILRTMGATQGAIMRVFMMTGASVGVVGTFVGFLLALLVCLNIESIRRFISWLTNTELFSPELYFLSKLPADLDAGETTAVVVMALALSLLATLYPAWRAARLDPVEALRYE